MEYCYETADELVQTWGGTALYGVCTAVAVVTGMTAAKRMWRYLDDKTKIALLYASGAGKTGSLKVCSTDYPDFHVLDVRSVPGHGARILYAYKNDVYATWQRRVNSRAHRRHATRKGTQGAMDLEDEVMHFFVTDHRTGETVDITDAVHKLRGPLDNYPDVTAPHLLLEADVHPRDHEHHSVTTRLYDGTIRELRGNQRVYEDEARV